MTNLQVNYNQLLETKRNNQAQLAESQRHNLATERLTQQKQSQDWQIATGQLDVARGNLNVSQARQAEDARHNLQSEATGWYNAAALNEHYQRADQNDRGANAIRSRQMQNDFYNAYWDRDVHQQEVNQKKFQNQEQARHNQTSELETTRSNRARERENTRHNLAQERENVRHNKKTEGAAVWQNINGSVNSAGNLISGAGKVASLFK
nr:hypothetical protein [Picobirnavirus sp.]